jgi:hypothetical protein
VAVVATGQVTLYPTGIASTLAFGVAVISDGTIITAIMLTLSRRSAGIAFSKRTVVFDFYGGDND